MTTTIDQISLALFFRALKCDGLRFTHVQFWFVTDIGNTMGFEQLAALRDQLVQQKKAEKPIKPRRKMVNETAAKPARKADPLVAIIGLLQKNFPLAFPKKPAPKVPLKIGIHHDLVAHAEQLGLSAVDIRAALKKWCQGKRYRECMVAGAARVDLQGQESGLVSKEEASYMEQRKSRPQASEPA